MFADLREHIVNLKQKNIAPFDKLAAQIQPICPHTRTEYGSWDHPYKHEDGHAACKTCDLVLPIGRCEYCGRLSVTPEDVCYDELCQQSIGEEALKTAAENNTLVIFMVNACKYICDINYYRYEGTQRVTDPIDLVSQQLLLGKYGNVDEAKAQLRNLVEKEVTGTNKQHKDYQSLEDEYNVTDGFGRRKNKTSCSSYVYQTDKEKYYKGSLFLCGVPKP